MRHDWVFDVLADLHSYALANDLPDLADKVAETLTLARREIGPDQGGLTAPEMLVFRARRRAH
jgi:hypothetical protein